VFAHGLVFLILLLLLIEIRQLLQRAAKTGGK
jgi:hypothetical protein